MATLTALPTAKKLPSDASVPTVCVSITSH